LAEKKQPERNNFLHYAGMGTQMLLTILVLVLAGRWLDKRFPPEFPLYTLLGALFGVSGSMYSFISKVK
jgi:NhaP-type Na+/H+ or K+/H+ antiporter